MVKRIVLFSDGTGNSSSSPFKTNVWRIYDALDLSPQNNQITFYDDGVGTSSNKYIAAITGAVGIGLKRNVLDIYKFLSRQYHDEILELQKVHGPTIPPQLLPTIGCFGFSRGSFTMRVLVGLVQSEGLLKHKTEEELEYAARRAYASFRLKAFKSKNPLVEACRYYSAKARTFFDARRKRAYDSSANVPAIGTPGVPAGTPQVGFEFVGLWDTVGAYGMPMEEFRVAIDDYIIPLTFADFFLCSCVKRIRHALCIDDERDAFTPIAFHDALDRAKERLEREAWVQEKGKTEDQAWQLVAQRSIQLWFAGVHANVGGGYPDDSLAYEPLNWILTEAIASGSIVCRASAVQDIALKATAFGKLYDSRAGLGGLYRYKPRDIVGSLRPPAGYLQKHSNIDPDVDALPLVHESVIFRLAAAYDAYAPIALGAKIGVVDSQNRLAHIVDFAVSRQARANAITGSSPLDQAVKALDPPSPSQRELVDASVFWRRVLYQTTIWPLILLALLPILGSDAQEPELPKWLAGLVSRLPENAGQEVSGALTGSVQLIIAFFSAVGDLFPTWASSWVSPWVNAWKAHPIIAFLLVLICLGSFRQGGRLRTLIADRSRSAWSSFTVPMPQSPLAKKIFDPLATRIATSEPLVHLWDNIVMGLVPKLITVAVFLLVLPAILDRVVFQAGSVFGAVCQGSGHGVITLSKSEMFSVSASNPCNASGFALERGRYYDADIEIADDWFDKDHTADLGGLRWRDLSGGAQAFYTLVAPAWRRVLSEEWFKPIFRVGLGGFAEFAAEPMTPFSPRDPHRKLHMRFKSPGDGELFVYVNDAYSGILPIGGIARGWVRHTYDNNKGTAKITIQPSD